MMSENEPLYPMLPFSALLFFYAGSKKAAEVKVRASTIDELAREMNKMVTWANETHHLTLKSGGKNDE